MFRAMIAPLVVGVAMSQTPVVAQTPQLDPNNAEHRFRALAVYSAAAVRCQMAEAADETTAYFLATNMIPADNAEAPKVFDEITALAKKTACADPSLIAMLVMARPIVQPVADGYTLAFLDQGFCPASALAADMRLYALTRDKGMPPTRRAAAAAARTEMAAHLKEACAQDYEALGVAFSLASVQAAVMRNDQAALFECRDGNHSPKLFECTYGEDKTADFRSRPSDRHLRHQQRAAMAKAAALELDATARCRRFTQAERAVGEAQMKIDARAVPLFKQASIYPRVPDKEMRFATAEEALAAGRATVAGLDCVAMNAHSAYGFGLEKPALAQGEGMRPGNGVERIRETLDRMAILLVSLPACPALPNFKVSQDTARTHVAGLSRERLWVAGSAVARHAEQLEEARCTPDKLPADFAASPLAALDALNGKWW